MALSHVAVPSSVPQRARYFCDTSPSHLPALDHSGWHPPASCMPVASPSPNPSPCYPGQLGRCGARRAGAASPSSAVSFSSWHHHVYGRSFASPRTLPFRFCFSCSADGLPGRHRRPGPTHPSAGLAAVSCTLSPSTPACTPRGCTRCCPHLHCPAHTEHCASPHCPAPTLRPHGNGMQPTGCASHHTTVPAAFSSHMASPLRQPSEGNCLALGHQLHPRLTR